MPAATEAMTNPMRQAEPAAVRLVQGDRVAIVAGSGRLPLDVAEGLSAAGHRPLVLAVEGEADANFDPAQADLEPMRLESFARTFDGMRRRGVTHLVLAGGIKRRPRFRDIVPTWSLLRYLPRVAAALRRGDNGLLAMLVAGLEGEGFKVVGAHQLVPDLVVESGPLTAVRPLVTDRADLDAAFAAAKALGGLDIGQAAVSIGGRVIAVEGIEGTDGLLARVRDLRGHGRIAGRTRGALVKCAKPSQELRADLPTIGPDTVDAAHAAGLAGIGVESGRAIVLQRTDTVRRADALGLFVVGLPQDIKP